MGLLVYLILLPLGLLILIITQVMEAATRRAHRRRFSPEAMAARAEAERQRLLGNGFAT
jgi:hypothetical protein